MKTYLKQNITLTVCLAVFISFMYLRANRMKSQDVLLLNNIEALAEGEYDFIQCVGDGKVECPVTHDQVKFVVF